jgi:L-iditol 2-dehydrogenase
MRVLATDLLESRLELAREFGAKWTWHEKAEGRRSKAEGNPNTETKKSSGEGGHAGSRTTTGRITPPRELAELVEEVTRGRGLDATVIAVPSDEVVRQAQQLVRGAGQVLLFSHTRRGAQTVLDLSEVCVDEKDLIGSYSADFTLQQEVARLVFSRKLDVLRLITHQFPLEQTAQAVELAAHPTRDSLKVVVSQMTKNGEPLICADKR